MRISDEVYARCAKFAQDRLTLSANLYKWRGEMRKDKMVEDCLVGTLGEFAAFSYLASKGIKVGEPDLTIYSSRKKSFKADLSNEQFDFHVKSQSKSSFKRYGASYLLQRTDKLVTQPTGKDYFIFVTVDGQDVEILGCVKVLDIHENKLWGQCRVPSYQHSKVAIYLEDFKKAGINLDCLRK